MFLAAKRAANDKGTQTWRILATRLQQNLTRTQRRPTIPPLNITVKVNTQRRMNTQKKLTRRLRPPTNILLKLIASLPLQNPNRYIFQTRGSAKRFPLYVYLLRNSSTSSQSLHTDGVFHAVRPLNLLLKPQLEFRALQVPLSVLQMGSQRASRQLLNGVIDVA